MLNYNLLQKTPKVEYIDGENPHFVIEDPLNDFDLYQYLFSRFPHINSSEAGENIAVRLSCLDALESKSVNAVWKSLFMEISTGLFFHAMLQIFAKPFAECHGSNEYARRIDSYPAIRDKSIDQELTTDCQFVINTPTSGGTTVRGPHFDSVRKLYALCWYFRDPADNSTGGDFGLYQHKGGKFKHSPQNQIREDDVELVKTVKYKQNVLVGFMNSKHSIHGVSVRGKSEYPRRYINVVAEQRKPLFKT